MNEGIDVLVGFDRAMQYPSSTCQKNVMKLNVFLRDLKKGIACLVNPFGHEQYPSNNLDQNNSTHGVRM
jgi:hypothetical protein